MPDMRTYFFVVPTKFRVNTMLRGTLLAELLRRPDTRVVIVSPFAGETDFRTEFDHPRVEHLPLAALNFGYLARAALRLREALLKADHPVLQNALAIMRGTRARRVIRGLSMREYLLIAMRRILQPLRPRIAALFDALEERLLYIPAYESACRTYRPEAVVLGTCDADPQDVVWLACARRFSVRAVVVDLPWNYLDDRMFSPPRPATICVWSERMAKHLEERFNVARDQIRVTGCLRYDSFAKPPRVLPREEFLRSIGADPGRKAIVYFLSGAHWHPHQHEVAKLVLTSIRSGTIAENPQLIVRFGPHERGVRDAFQALAREYPDDMVFDWAEETPGMDRVLNLLFHSDISLSIFSSLALDAAILDKPMFYTGFSGFPVPYKDDAAIARIYEFDFVRRALGTGGVRVAYDTSSFLSLLNESLKNPQQDKEGRKELVRHFLGTIDGKAGERIARIIEKA